MKAILISIKPKYVKAILNGEKTVEIRKSIPNFEKCQRPIFVYIYVTKDKKDKLFRNNSNYHYFLLDTETDGFNGQVVARFSLGKIDEITNMQIAYGYKRPLGEYLKESCLTYDEMSNYLKDKKGYVWYITDLKIFDQPKQLNNFLVKSHTVDGVGFKGEPKTFDILKPLTKAPQSWCYVERE